MCGATLEANNAARDLTGDLLTATPSEISDVFEIKRFFDLLFGDPRRSPLPDEFGVFQATDRGDVPGERQHAIERK